MVQYGSIWFKMVQYGQNWSAIGATAVGVTAVRNNLKFSDDPCFRYLAPDVDCAFFSSIFSMNKIEIFLFHLDSEIQINPEPE